MGTLKKGQTREISFKTLQSSVLDLVATQSSFLRPPPPPPPALVGNHKRPATEKTNQQKNKKTKKPWGHHQWPVSPKEVVRMRITAAPLPLCSLLGSTFGEVLIVHSQNDTDGVCALYNMAAALNMNAALRLVSTDHIPLSFLHLRRLRFQMFGPTDYHRHHHHHLQKQHRATTVCVACLQVAMRFRLKKHESASSILILMQS